LPSESPAQKAVVVRRPIGECDPLAVGGLDQRQAMLPRESRIVVGGGVDTDMEFCIAHRADLTR